MPLVPPTALLEALCAHSGAPLLLAALASLGLATLLRYPLSFLRLLLSYTPLARPLAISLKSLAKNSLHLNGPPAWAIITGPTGGIGKEFSFQLARAGFSLLLVGRSSDRLLELANHIQAISSIGLVQTHTINLESASDSDWDLFAATLNQLSAQAPISLVVNNAGLSHNSPVPFESTPLSELRSITNVNIIAPLRLTQIALPHMIKHRKGLILNLGSFSALVPTPLLATYAGSKGFLYTWTQALGTELEPKGIHVRLLNTYFVTSEMSKIRRPSALVPSPKQFVQSVLDHLGLSGGAAGKCYVSTPYFTHGLVQWVIDRFGSQSFWLNYNLKLQLSILKRVEKKKLRELESKKTDKND